MDILDIQTRTSFNYKEELTVFEDLVTEFKDFNEVAPSAWLQSTENGCKNYKTLTKAIVSFLNRHGGRIFIGINNETRRVLGVPYETADYMKNVISHIGREISPDPDFPERRIQVKVVPINGSDRYVVKVLVKKGERTQIYSTSSTAFNFYWRNDGNVHAYSLEEYRREFVKRLNGTFNPKAIEFPDWDDSYSLSSELEAQPYPLIKHLKETEIEFKPPINGGKIPHEILGHIEEEKKEERKEEKKKDILDLSSAASLVRNNYAQVREEQRRRQGLPIYKLKDQIVNTIHQFPITLIKGSTGSGKTTQIPQYLMESELFRGKIILAQPYKESLASISKRIELESGEKTDIVSIMDNKKSSEYTSKLHLMTHEALIFQLLFNPDLHHYSCIIVDESHERYIDTDVVGSLLKYLLKEKIIQNIRVVFASATLDVETFKKSMQEEGLPYDFIDIPGVQYPIYDKWNLASFPEKQALTSFGNKTKKKENKSQEEMKLPDPAPIDDYQEELAKFAESSVPERNACPEYAIQLIKKLIGDNYKQLTGHVLVFVPRTNDTRMLTDYFKNRKEIEEIFDIMIFHGNLTLEESQRIFEEPAEGKKYKMIFSTKHGQNAITINNLFAVIDSGWDTFTFYDRKTETNTEEVNVISQSQSIQRRGRVGRTCPGLFLPMYSHKDFTDMDKFESSVMERFPLHKMILWVLRMKRNAFTMKFVEKCSKIEQKYLENLLIRMNPGSKERLKEIEEQNLMVKIKKLNMTIPEDEEEFGNLMTKAMFGLEEIPKKLKKRFRKVFEVCTVEIEKGKINLTDFKWFDSMSDKFKSNLIKDCQKLIVCGLVKYIDLNNKFQALKSCMLTELGSFASEKDIHANQIRVLYESLVYECSDKVCRAMSIRECDWTLFERRFSSMQKIKRQWQEESEVSDWSIYLKISEAYDEKLNEFLELWAKKNGLTDEKMNELFEESLYFSDYQERVYNELLKKVEREELEKSFEIYRKESRRKFRQWAEGKHLSSDTLLLAQKKLEYYIIVVEEMKSRLRIPEKECRVKVNIDNKEHQSISLSLISEFGQNNLISEDGGHLDGYGCTLVLRVGSADDKIKVVYCVGQRSEKNMIVLEVPAKGPKKIIEHNEVRFDLQLAVKDIKKQEDDYLKCFFIGYVTDCAIQKETRSNIFDLLRLSYGFLGERAKNDVILDTNSCLDVRNTLLKIITCPMMRGTIKGKVPFISYQFKADFASYVNEEWFYELQEPAANYRRYYEKTKTKQEESPKKPEPKPKKFDKSNQPDKPNRSENSDRYNQPKNSKKLERGGNDDKMQVKDEKKNPRQGLFQRNTTNNQ